MSLRGDPGLEIEVLEKRLAASEARAAGLEEACTFIEAYAAGCRELDPDVFRLRALLAAGPSEAFSARFVPTEEQALRDPLLLNCGKAGMTERQVVDVLVMALEDARGRFAEHLKTECRLSRRVRQGLHHFHGEAVTAALTPEQERALRKAAEGSGYYGIDPAHVRLLLAALDAERERSAQLQVGSGNFEAAHVRAIRERDAARSELAEARAEIERLSRGLRSARDMAQAHYAQILAILALRDLPPGAPAPEHEGEAYAVAVGLLNSLQGACDQVASLLDAGRTARARVAELEGQLHDKGSEVGVLKLTLRNVDAGRIATEARVAELEGLAHDLALVSHDLQVENERLRAAAVVGAEVCLSCDAEPGEHAPGCLFARSKP